jgi:hypothetical protein
MLSRITKMFAHHLGFRRGYQSGLRKSRAAAHTFRTELLSDAHDAAARTTAAAHAEAVAIHTANAEAGQADGYQKGKELGERMGHADGHKRAVDAVADKYGLFAGSLAVTVDHSSSKLALLTHHPNIFMERASLQVRIVAADVLKRQEFPFSFTRRQHQYARFSAGEVDRNSWVAAMLDAIEWRNQYAARSGSDQDALFQEVHEEVYGGTTPPSMETVYDIAVAFHRRVMQSELELDELRFLGEDPEDRFDIKDKAVLPRAWTALYGDKIPNRIEDAMTQLGLGSHENPRTVREVLLFTRRDFLDCRDVGKVSVDGLSKRLGVHGLALWGQEIEQPPTGPARHSGRNLRSIDLDFGDEDEP